MVVNKACEKFLIAVVSYTTPKLINSELQKSKSGFPMNFMLSASKVDLKELEFETLIPDTIDERFYQGFSTPLIKNQITALSEL